MSPSLRICIVSPHCYPLFKEGAAESAGGAEVQLKTLGAAFCGCGYEVHFIVDDFGQDDVVYESGIILHKVPFRYMGGSNLHLPIDWLRFVNTLARIKADVHLMKVPRNLLLPLACYSRMRRSKAIYVGQRDVDSTREGARSADRLPSYLFYRAGLVLVNAVIAQTKRQQQNFLLSLNKQTTVIPNIVTLPEECITEKSDYVLWVGNSSQRKQPEEFLKVVRLLPSIQFRMVMASSNKKEYDKYISDQAGELENLTFLGFVPFQKIKKEYRNARLFVSTSLSEGFPNTFLQAWQYRVPVVSMHVDPDGVIEKYGLGAVSGSQQRLLEDIQALINDRLQWEKLSDNAAEYVRDNHSVQATVDSYNKLFIRLGLLT